MIHKSPQKNFGLKLLGRIKGAIDVGMVAGNVDHGTVTLKTYRRKAHTAEFCETSAPFMFCLSHNFTRFPKMPLYTHLCQDHRKV